MKCGDRFWALLAALSLSACGGGEGSSGENGAPPPAQVPVPVTYSIGGTASGVQGTGLVLQLGGANNLPISTDGAFSFGTSMAAGTNYTVTVLTQPSSPAQSCAVSAGTGTVAANVNSVQVACTTLPLEVVATNPADGSRDVARTLAPSMDFSAPLDAVQPLGSALSLTEVGRDAVPGIASIDVGRMTFAPEGALWPFTEYELTTSGVTGAHGEAMASAVRTRFSTGDGQWTFDVPESREMDDVIFESVLLAVNSQGAGVAAWIGKEPGVYDDQLLVSTRAAGDGWSASAPISANTGVASLGVTVDELGIAHVVWVDSEGTGQTRVFASSADPASGLWSAPEQLSDELQFRNVAVSISSGSAGVFAVWMAGDGQTHSIHMARRVGDTWMPPSIVNEGSDTASMPQVAADEAGHALFVWAEQSGNTNELKSRLFHDDGVSAGWAHGEISVSEQGRGFTDGSGFRLALNDEGLGALIWTGAPGTSAADGLWAALYTVDVFHLGLAMGWGGATDLEGGQSMNGTLADIAVDGQGDVLAAWVGEYAGSESQILSRRLSRLAIARAPSSTSAWGELELLGEGAWPHVALDARGNGFLWWYPSTGPSTIQTRRLTRRNGWSEPEQLRPETNSGSFGNCEIAFDGHGSAAAVWLEVDTVAGHPSLVGMFSARFN
jgi:Bacterial Ig-like domain